MARKLQPDEAISFAQDLASEEVRAADDFSLESLGDRRDAILSMSPELRAFFGKDSRQCSQE